MNLEFTKIAYIYALSDSRNPENIRYIGKTEFPKKRIRGHHIESKKRKGYKNNWIQNVLQAKAELVMKIIRIVPLENWENAERQAIEEFGKAFRLTNGNKGGIGGGYPEDWVIKKMSESAKKRTESVRNSTASTIRKLWQNPEYRKRLVDAHKGKIPSKETLAKRSMALKGKVRTKETIEKLRIAITADRGVQIKRLDTGEVFETMIAAAKTVGSINGSALLRSLMRGRPTYRGVKFEFMDGQRKHPQLDFDFLK